MIRSYEYRLYPSQQQSADLDDMLVRFCTLYNAALEERLSAYAKGVKLNYADQALQLRIFGLRGLQLAG